MTTQTSPGLRKPGNLDLKKGQTLVKKVIRENKEWIKEMADK